MKIAVIGAGLAGLAAAWLLSRRHEVTLFERFERPGFTARNLSLVHEGRTVAIDVPLRMFHPGHCPTLSRLYQQLGVLSEPVADAASFMAASGQLYFRYRSLRLGARSIAVLAPQDLLLGARAWRIVAGLLRFHRGALRTRDPDGRGSHANHGNQRGFDGRTIGEYVAALGEADDFADGFLLPAICTLCGCTYAQARSFPATVIVDYLARGLVRQGMRRVLHGADDVQQRLLQGIGALRCAAPVGGVRRSAEGVLLRSEDGSLQRFDHAVLATQANQARRLLHDAREDEALVLDAFGYQPVDVVTHRDERLMPTRRRDWSPVNLRVDPEQAAPESTLWINAVQRALRKAAPLFQTINPQRQPREGRVLGHARFERPVVDSASQRALAALHHLHAESDRRVWFCGSYAQAGIPLLESAAHSAHEVALRLGAPLP